MAEAAEVLDYLWGQFARVNGKLDRLTDDVTNLKVRTSSIEGTLGHLRIGLGAANDSLDRLDSRVEVIERRLEIGDTSLQP